MSRFDRIRQEQEDIARARAQRAREGAEQEEQKAQQARQAAQRQEARYRAALTFYQETGLDENLKELANLIKGQFRDKEPSDHPERVVKRITWAGRKVGRDMDTEYQWDVMQARAIQVETDPEGTVHVLGAGGFFSNDAHIKVDSWRKKLKEGKEPFEAPLDRAYRSDITFRYNANLTNRPDQG